MIDYAPRRIIIEQSVRQNALTKKILEKFPKIQKQVVKKIPQSLPGITNNTLIISQQKGAGLVSCPGTPAYLCCNYYILDIGFGCTYNCSYCFLQHYRNTPGLIIYVNFNDILRKLTHDITHNSISCKRIGTGEFTDSLLLDHITGYSKKLVAYFSDKQIALELKTKSNNIQNLMGLTHNKRTVVAWSLNPEPIIQTEERAAATLSERFAAAQRCQHEGYPLAFHFDPIIYSAFWEKQYKEVIKKLQKAIDPKHVMWISLGTLRFNPGLKPLIQKYFPKSKIMYEEMIRGLDGKFRYIQPIRIEIYQKMAEWLKAVFPQTPVYLCMESPAVWKRSLGFCPNNPKELEEYIISRWEQIKR